MLVDVAIVGGGPAGLSAALTLGRARKKVALFDAGPPRNAAATRVQGFVTRDGTPPAEFRRIARDQLRPYEQVEVRNARVEAISREGAVFHVKTAAESVTARRALLCLGMVDELPAIPGYRKLWGKSVFQCPYCHAWEIKGRAFGYLAKAPTWVEWALFLKGWTSDVTAFTNGAFEVPGETRAKLEQGRVRIEERRVTGLRAQADHLAAVELEGGAEVALDALFSHPPQRQAALVSALGLELDDLGFVRVDEHQQTSVPGIYAAGDLTTMKQSAVLAAASGMLAASMLNHALTIELALAGEL
jgi:thioredoxin reductase